jgi:hypothetical protein
MCSLYTNLFGSDLGVVFPGAVFIIGSWYRQYETAKRVSIFYMAALLASAFGPIVSQLSASEAWIANVKSSHMHYR